MIPALKKLQKKGWKIIIGTNQAGIARGYVKIKSLDEIHEKLLRLFKLGGVRIAALYFCPHHPDDGCLCRKPQPRMILNAQKKFNLDLAQSFVIGDRESDIWWGQGAGLRSILVLTGYGRRTRAQKKAKPDFIARSLPWAVRKILEMSD